MTQENAEVAAGPLPTGTVTFLLTDIEGSTRLWEANPAAMSAALAEHDRLMSTQVAAHGGVVIKRRGEGDSCFIVFARASDAIAAAAAIQRIFGESEFPGAAAIKVRIGVHTGEAELREGDYFGPTVNRSARLRSLAQGGQVLVSAAARALAGSLPAGLGFSDLGEHRLKGVETPERVFQLTGEGLLAGFAPLAGEVAEVGNLPVPLSSFIGRQHELDELAWLLAEARLLVVTGVGGGGKSRIAVELARRVVSDYPGGAWLVTLGDLTDPSRIGDSIAAALGLREQAGRPLLDTLVEALRSRPILLLLDNCEHLLPASAELAASLLGDCPALKVLATSREPLNLRGERVWLLPPLALEAAADLFADRARGLGANLGPDQREGIAEICRQLDGIPLAVELAAGRSRILTPAQIATRLSDRFQLLAGAGRNVNARHLTLRATIDWSYRLLAEPEAALFAELTVFAGGFTLEAVEAVATGEQSLDGLLGLVDKSLVMVEPEGSRYRLLETIRAYGRQKLSEAAAATVGARHAAYFNQLANSLSQVEPARLRPELDNLRAALRWCDEHDPRLGLELAAGLGAMWPNIGFISEGRDWLARFLAFHPEHDRLAAFAHHELGWLYIWQAIFDRAVEHFRLAAELAGESRDRDLRARAINAEAFVEIQRHHTEETRRLVLAALPELRSGGDPLPLAQALFYLALAGIGADPTAVQLERLEEAGRLFGQLGLDTDVGMVLVNVGIEHVLAGDLDAAEAALKDALAIRLRLRDLSRLSATMAAVACLAARRARHRQALMLFGADLKCRTQLGITIPPNFDRTLEPIREESRRALGAESAAIEAAGYDLPTEDALAFAVSVLEE